MKLLFLLVGCVFGTTAFAQISEEDLKAKLEKAIIKKIPEGQKIPLAFRKLKLDTASTGLINGRRVAPGVYRLKQDGMPCIVPDTKGIAYMPNAFGRVEVPFKTNIPNAWERQSPVPPTGKK